ncbi:unnamed protein product [Rotaria sp. Silwood1]|nr:unnamed protein product [Rotaria sp. Silwood1]
MQTHSTLDTSSNNLFTNIERLGTRDLLSYGQLSYDTILTSIQSNNTLPLSVNSLFDCLFFHHGSIIYLSDLFTSSQHLSNLYDEYFCTWFDEDDLTIFLISYNLCKPGILLGQTTKEHNELYIRLIEHDFKLTKIHAYASCLFLLEVMKFLLTLSRFSARFEESDNRLFLIAGQK